MSNAPLEGFHTIQRALCEQWNAEFLAVRHQDKLGITEEALQGVFPIHGLRHRPEDGTSGWFIWSGEYSEAEDFFMPMHVEHVMSVEMAFSRCLGLAPGWRFLIGEDGYEDIWFDPELLDT